MKHPLNDAVMTASYKSPEYLMQFGFNHYGCDYFSQSSKKVYSPSNAEVKKVGFDKICGNVVILYHPNEQVISRFFHLAEILVSEGDEILTGEEFAIYGNTGSYTTGAHLHVEFDTDTIYYDWTPTLSRSSNILRAGIDTTIDPEKIFGGYENYLKEVFKR